MLETRDLEVHYGRLVANRGISCTVAEGTVVVLVGPNGAGKTTFVNAVMGIAPTSQGAIVFDGQDIAGLSIEQRSRAGIAVCREGRAILPELTVSDNLRLGTGPRSRRGLQERKAKVLALFPILADRLDVAAGFLSGGQQQQLAIGRALMSDPRLLILDEPCFGLDPRSTQLVVDLIDRLRKEGMTLLVVEQNVERALRMADWAYVMSVGVVALEGPGRSLSRSDVEVAYLGHASAD